MELTHRLTRPSSNRAHPHRWRAEQPMWLLRWRRAGRRQRRGQLREWETGVEGHNGMESRAVVAAGCAEGLSAGWAEAEVVAAAARAAAVRCCFGF